MIFLTSLELKQIVKLKIQKIMKATVELTKQEIIDCITSINRDRDINQETAISLTNQFRKALGWPINLKYDKSWENVAKILMEYIQYFLNRRNINLLDREFPQEYVDRIKTAAEKFFSSNPEYLDETCLEELGYGSEKDLEKYRTLKDFKELGDALTEYFLEVK